VARPTWTAERTLRWSNGGRSGSHSGVAHPGDRCVGAVVAVQSQWGARRPARQHLRHQGGGALRHRRVAVARSAAAGSAPGAAGGRGAGGGRRRALPGPKPGLGARTAVRAPDSRFARGSPEEADKTQRSRQKTAFGSQEEASKPQIGTAISSRRVTERPCCAAEMRRRVQSRWCAESDGSQRSLFARAQKGQRRQG